MKYPKISIITPSYNQGNYIEETIKSVLEQKYPNLEYIIIDGGSTDNSKEIIERYSNRLFYWISEKDNGQSNAINKGLKIASGDILAYLNSDDIYLPGTLSKIANYYINNPNVYFTTGNYYVINEKSKKLYIINYGCYVEKELKHGVNRIGQPSTFWRKEVINKIGLFDENLHYSMDFDFFLRSGRYYTIYHLNYPLAAFREHSSSKSIKNNKIQKNEKTQILMKLKYINYSKSKIFYKIFDLRVRFLKYLRMLKGNYLLKHIFTKLIKVKIFL